MHGSPVFELGGLAEVEGLERRSVGPVPRRSVSVPALLKLLDDSDSRVRWTAALAVGRLGDRSVLPELRRRLGQAEGDFRERLEQAIREIDGRTP